MERNLLDAALFFLILAMCCLGCGVPDDEQLGVSAAPGMVQPKGIWVAPGAPQEPVLAACAEWAETGLTCEMAPSRSAAWITVDVDPSTDCGAGLPLGHAPPRSISLRTACWPHWMDRHYFQMVAATAHEFGHALGLGHVKDEAALMAAAASGALGLSTADRMEFLRVWGTTSPP